MNIQELIRVIVAGIIITVLFTYFICTV